MDDAPRTVHYGQATLINDFTRDEHLVVAGVGYGKTFAGPPWHYARVLANPHSDRSIIVAPTYSLVAERCLEEYRKFLGAIGLVEGKGGDYWVNWSKMYLDFRTGHRVLFLSSEAVEHLVGHNICCAWVDEAALCDQQVPKNLIKRLRCPKASVTRQILYTSTPEGQNWLYDKFHPDEVVRREGTPFSWSDTKLVLHGRSHDNPYLDEKYLSKLEEEFGWDPAYYANYVLGEWTSLSRNSYYFNFNQAKHVGDYPVNKDIGRLYLSFDNNVGQMIWVVMQNVANEYWVVRDNGGRARNLEEACEQFVEAFPPHEWRDFAVVVLGDAALHARSVHSYNTGYGIIAHLLKPYYPLLTVEASRGNPEIEERQRITNRLFFNNRIRIDRKCNKVLESARSVEMDSKGRPKKGSNDRVTHAMEAVDMALAKLEPPIIRREFVGAKL